MNPKIGATKVPWHAHTLPWHFLAPVENNVMHTLLAYILLTGSLVGYAFFVLASPPNERRSHMIQLFAAMFVGALILLVTPT